MATVINVIEAQPFRFPIAGSLDPRRTAFIAIDMQVDFCGEGGLVDRWGRLAPMRAPIGPIARCFAAARRAGIRIIHTRETYKPDLSDFPPMRHRRQTARGVATGDSGPKGRHLIEGEPCWDFVPELKPLPGETVIDKPGYGAFYKTDLEAILRKGGIAQLVLTGVTTDCCVNSTLREAEDRGFECLVIEDGCAAPRPESHAAMMAMLRTGGVFGTVADSAAFIASLERIPARAAG
jgi:nicotinamidase-related amidase